MACLRRHFKFGLVHWEKKQYYNKITLGIERKQSDDNDKEAEKRDKKIFDSVPFKFILNDEHTFIRVRKEKNVI